MTISSHQQNVPRLRFPEFSGEWEYKRLDEVATITTGSTPPTANREFYNGDELFVSPADMEKQRYIQKTNTTLTQLGFSKGRKIDSGSVLFVCIGSTIGKVSQCSKECVTNQQINALTAKKKFFNDFIFSLLEKESSKIKRLAGVNAVPQINKSEFSKLKFLFPDEPEEQQKIASFLSSVDKKIEQLAKKKQLLERYKKGMMQRLFSQQIRFKDANGNDYPAWEEKKLGDISTTTTGSSNREDSTEEGEYTFFDRSNDKRASSKYLFDCEAIIVAGEGKDFPPRYFVGKFDLHQRAYATMEFKENSGRYIYYWIFWHRAFFLKHSVGSTMPSLRMDSFTKFPVRLPHPDEQTKIANFLSAIDDKINLIESELTHAQTFKKGLLQQMFV